MVYTMFELPPKTETPAGDHYINTYQEIINKKGKMTLEKTGQTNVYELIQADAESCKIENIMKRAAMGDLSALQQRDATYVDATTLPKSLMEAQNLTLRLKDEFYKMPLEVRREFDNSPEQYVALMGTQEFKEIMAPYNAKIAAIAQEKNDKEYRAKVKEGAKLNIDIAREQKIMEGGSGTNE